MKKMSYAEFKKRRCTECNGAGILSIDKFGNEEQCKKCHGTGIIRGKKK